MVFKRLKMACIVIGDQKFTITLDFMSNLIYIL